MKKIAILGYGAATIGFLMGLFERNYSVLEDLYIDIYDQNQQENAGGLGGLAYDGKMIVGQYSGSDELIPLSIQYKLLEFFLSHSNYQRTEKDEQQLKFIKQFQEELYKNEMLLSKQQTFHLGTDELKEVNSKILLNFQKLIGRQGLNIHFKFGIQVDANILSSIKNDYDIIIVAVGRYGTNLINQIVKTYDGDQKLILSNNKVDIGIRYELPSSLPSISKLDNALYQWKIKYKTGNNMMVRTFCHNPKGYVITQNLNILGRNIAIVNGHSVLNNLSNNTNFAILVTQAFIQPFNDSVLYGKIISQQANLLAGSSKKVILQTLGDFKNKKRTKHLFRVKPTLDSSKYELGDLTYILPAKIYEALIQFMNKLSIVVPQILYPDNLLYGIETKFYGTKMNNTKKYKFIGDCSGRSRSIISAASTGYMLAKTI